LMSTSKHRIITDSMIVPEERVKEYFQLHDTIR
jgi:hypothetical protein